eukprot:1204479-Rhodomonas_salina.1
MPITCSSFSFAAMDPHARIAIAMAMAARRFAPVPTMISLLIPSSFSKTSNPCPYEFATVVPTV